MSIASVYCHPDRTVVSTWDIRDGIPVLSTMRFAESLSEAWWLGHESLPVPDAIAAAAASSSSIRIALPSPLFTLLRYPITAGENADERMHFEFSVNEPNVRRSTHAFSALHTMHDAAQRPWSLACAVATRVLDSAARFSSAAVIAPSCLCEASAVRHAVHQTDSMVALIGKRGAWWEAFVVTPQHEVEWTSAYHDDTTLDYSVQAREILLDLRAASNGPISTVLLYGDDITKDAIDSCIAGMQGIVDSVQRMNPFKLVGADADDETKRLCIRFAHMLGPVVGQVLTQPHLSFPCASSAAR